MAYFNHNNTEIKLNNQRVHAQRVGIDLSTSLAPNYISETRGSFSKSVENGIAGSMSFSYFLTGVDFLKDFITNETEVISGNLGGIYFRSGYLTSYSFDSQPHQPVSVEASISFFELTGTFSNTVTSVPDEIKTLNFSDIVLNESGIISTDQAVSFSYNFESNIEPCYKVGDRAPSEIRFMDKTSSMNVSSHDVSGVIPPEGHPGSLFVKLYDSNSNYVDTYSVKGIVENRSIETSVGERILSRFNIIQNFAGDTPVISGIDPSTGFAGNGFRISGKNFKDIKNVFILDTKLDKFSIMNTELITGVVPTEAVTGPVKISSLAGDTSSSWGSFTGFYNVGDLGITVG